MTLDQFKNSNHYTPEDFSFQCNETMTGLNMTGSFGSLGQDINVSDSSLEAIHVEYTNTLTTKDVHFGFRYFDDSSNQRQVEA